ncbi:hypothetical protein [Bordetella sp. 02P26C-1]|uniref:hypothetical protein n=1 Tax=Bordetella sp. 02P26C-1 TaxID=2683195 RepID=UPI001353D5F7|nr:hypothetical protein [Bordetella sp. 02P26C-1]MVW80028.1 hypothetical protein [Bordetella sp. 02P26C-1]
MPRINVKQGELAHWLQLIAAERDTGLAPDAVPSNVREGLILLSCVTESEQGRLMVTEKGRLSLRMAGPDAIHLS